MNRQSFTVDNVIQRARRALDGLCGLDFLMTTEPEEVGFDSHYVHRSCPSGDRYLVRALRVLRITRRDSIIDVGCGRGSAMRTMLRFPFARVDGIEISEQIAGIAARNFRKLRASRAKVFFADAARFDGYDLYNMVYFYNPFPESVMDRVVQAILQSLRRSDRELIIVYNNSRCNAEIVVQRAFAKLAVFPNRWGTGISIYSNRHGSDSRLSYNRIGSVAPKNRRRDA
jgi:precorrin-6B methylase 2